MSQTWVIKDTAPVDEASRTLNQTNILFTSDNKRGTYIGIFNTPGGDAVLSYGDIGDVAGMNMGSGDTSFVWGKEAFKTLEFDTAPTGELLTWLQKNADKYDPEYLTRESELTSVANAIREKGGTTDPLIYPDGFVTAIESIEAGGGADISPWRDIVTFSITPSEDLTGNIDFISSISSRTDMPNVFVLGQRATTSGPPYAQSMARINTWNSWQRLYYNYSSSTPTYPTLSMENGKFNVNIGTYKLEAGVPYWGVMLWCK